MENRADDQYAFKRACEQFDSGAALTIEDIQGFFAEFAMAVNRTRKPRSLAMGHVERVSPEAKAAIGREPRP